MAKPTEKKLVCSYCKAPKEKNLDHCPCYQGTEWIEVSETEDFVEKGDLPESFEIPEGYYLTHNGKIRKKAVKAKKRINRSFTEPLSFFLYNGKAGESFITDKSDRAVTGLARNFKRKVTTKRLLLVSIVPNHPTRQVVEVTLL